MIQCSSQHSKYQRLFFVLGRRLVHVRGSINTRAQLVSEEMLGPL